MLKKFQDQNLDLSELNLRGKSEFACVLVKNKSKISKTLNVFFKDVKNEASDASVVNQNKKSL